MNNLTKIKLQLTGKAKFGIKYCNSSQQYYDLFIPENKKSDKLFFSIHGGGYVMGSADAEDDRAYEYSRKGYWAISVNYSNLSQTSSIQIIMAELFFAVSKVYHSIWNEYKSVIKKMAIFGYSDGLKDVLVPIFNREEFLKIVEKAEFEVKVIDYPNSNHDLSPDSDSDKKWVEAEFEFFKKYM